MPVTTIRMRIPVRVRVRVRVRMRQVENFVSTIQQVNLRGIGEEEEVKRNKGRGIGEEE